MQVSINSHLLSNNKQQMRTKSKADQVLFYFSAMTKCSFLGRKSNISQETLSKSHLVAHSVQNELRPILKGEERAPEIQYSQRTF